MNYQEAIQIAEGVSFIEKNDKYVGNIIINNLLIPLPENDPLGVMWAKGPKKWINENYGLMVTGIFNHDQDEKIISGVFYQSIPDVEEETKEERERRVKKYTKKFEETFDRQMVMFQDIIIDFLLDEKNGYIAYLDLCEIIIKEDKYTQYRKTKKFFSKFCDKIERKYKDKNDGNR